eukprot:gene11642-13594_t
MHGSYGLQCRQDGDDNNDVAWWLIIKLPKFQDFYIYYDSNMDAFGKALADLDSDACVNYVAYNDHFREGSTDFYTASYVHDKGIIGWGPEDDVGGTQEGIWLQHTFPNFPIPSAPQRPSPATPFNPPDVPDYQRGEELRFAFDGWPNMFPPSINNHLGTAFAGGVKKNGQQISQAIATYLQGHPGLGNPRPNTNEQVNPISFGRPAQHILCVSLNTDALNTAKIILGDLAQAPSTDYIVKDPTSDPRIFQRSHATNKLGGAKMAITMSTTRFYLMRYANVDNGPQSIWDSIFTQECDRANHAHQPCIPTGVQTQQKMSISTWVSYPFTEKKLKDEHIPNPAYFNLARFSVTFAAPTGTQVDTVIWGLGADIFSDHSKIGYISNPDDTNLWHTCFNAPNLGRALAQSGTITRSTSGHYSQFGQTNSIGNYIQSIFKNHPSAQAFFRSVRNHQLQLFVQVNQNTVMIPPPPASAPTTTTTTTTTTSTTMSFSQNRQGNPMTTISSTANSNNKRPLMSVTLPVKKNVPNNRPPFTSATPQTPLTPLSSSTPATGSVSTTTTICSITPTIAVPVSGPNPNQVDQQCTTIQSKYQNNNNNDEDPDHDFDFDPEFFE